MKSPKKWKVMKKRARSRDPGTGTAMFDGAEEHLATIGFNESFAG
jgi:hypothetical protein